MCKSSRPIWMILCQLLIALVVYSAFLVIMSISISLFVDFVLCVLMFPLCPFIQSEKCSILTNISLCSQARSHTVGHSLWLALNWIRLCDEFRLFPNSKKRDFNDVTNHLTRKTCEILMSKLILQYITD